MKVHVISWCSFLLAPPPLPRKKNSILGSIYIFIVYKLTLYQRSVKKPWLWTFVNRIWSKSIEKKTITHINTIAENREKNRFRKSDCQNSSSILTKHTSVFDALTYWSVLTSTRRLVIKFQETWYSWYLCVGIWSNSK